MFRKITVAAISRVCGGPNVRRIASAKMSIQESIRQKLSTNLQTTHLDVINESNMHNVPNGAETHFRVVVVSDKFNGVSLLQRHRMVNDLLKYELENGVHALSIVTKSPEQWAQMGQPVKPSPKCLGGYGK